jgi:hypothetical protein
MMTFDWGDVFNSGEEVLGEMGNELSKWTSYDEIGGWRSVRAGDAILE